MNSNGFTLVKYFAFQHYIVFNCNIVLYINISPIYSNFLAYKALFTSVL